jgi:hypothetical protein
MPPARHASQTEPEVLGREARSQPRPRPASHACIAGRRMEGASNLGAQSETTWTGDCSDSQGAGCGSARSRTTEETAQWLGASTAFLISPFSRRWCLCEPSRSPKEKGRDLCRIEKKLWSCSLLTPRDHMPGFLIPAVRSPARSFLWRYPFGHSKRRGRQFVRLWRGRSGCGRRGVFHPDVYGQMPEISGTLA